MGRRTKVEERLLNYKIEAALDAGETVRSISERLRCSTTTITKINKLRESRRNDGTATAAASAPARRTPRTSSPPPSIANAYRAEAAKPLIDAEAQTFIDGLLKLSEDHTAAEQKAASADKALRPGDHLIITTDEATGRETAHVRRPALELHAGDQVILDRAVLQVARINSDGTLRLVRLNGALFAEAADASKVTKR